MTKKEQIVKLAGECCTLSEIAKTVGVSRQYVSQVCCQNHLGLSDFRKLSETDCIYAGIRSWWNDNRMTYKKFFNLIGMTYHNANIVMLKRYLSGENSPRKDYIDKLIAATGISYEQLFRQDSCSKHE